MITNILIPTDGSDTMGPAVEAALTLADTYDAILHVLYVVNQPTTASGLEGGFIGYDNLLDEREKAGRCAIETITAHATDRDIETETAVQRGKSHDGLLAYTGNPRDDILTYAIEHGIDVIVMGTHGRTGVKRALLGSVTEDVVRHADISVVTVPRDPEQ